MSHLVKALALSVVLSCSGSKPAEPPAAVPVAEPAEAPPAAALPAEEPAAAGPSSGSDASVAPAEPATATQSVPVTLFVGAALVPCQGEAPQQCLQVREKESLPYRNLYSGIEGFDYEPSYVYELRVEAIAVARPPADASAVRYRLLQVVAKRKAVAAKSP